MFDLNNLSEKELNFGTPEDFKKRQEKRDALKQECKEKYGNEWWEHYLQLSNPSYGMDFDEEYINGWIFYGSPAIIIDGPQKCDRLRPAYIEKLKRLFGRFRYRKYIEHEMNLPEVNEALIKDALKTGKWRELPKQLQDEYRRQAGNANGL